MRPESLYFLFSPVTRIKGVGSAVSGALQRLLPPSTIIAGSTTPIVRDVLFHLPIGIVDRRFTCPLHSAPDGKVATFVVTVDEHFPPRGRGSKSPYKVVCSNDTGDITLVFFHAHTDYIKQSLPVGAKRVISGRCERFDYRLQMPHPDIIAPVEKLSEVMRPEPVYPLTVGITSRRIAGIVGDALAKIPELPEWLLTSPSPLVGEGWDGGHLSTHSILNAKHHSPLPNPPPQGGRESDFPSWKHSLQKAHHPESEQDLQAEAPPRLRLAYDEILAFQLHLGLLRRSMQQQAGEIIKGTGALTDALIKALPFMLTNGQQQALGEIYEDMQSGHRMGRLLQGDVGSGKTVVALMAMLRATEQGLQSALMVPTEIIARQHFEVISRLVADLPVGVALLTGSIKGARRAEALADIASGKAQIVIGTHALFQEHVEFNNLALVVIDEQHRFGVEQRMALTSKGHAPHILHMTATPIPRSLTMTLYGDMDCSQLKEKPVGRQPIATRVIPLSRYAEIMDRLKAALDKGEKAYWICPLIEEGRAASDEGREGNNFDPGPSTLDPEQDLAAAKSRFTEFKARFGNIVGLVHGRMKADERDEQMEKFTGGKTRLLVATTVVEVGVDVRDATIMVIEKAERFGLSQLHQLRGRVGRGERPSACVLLYSSEGQAARGEWEENIAPRPSPLDPIARLRVLRETEDGFRIAEEDLKIRGGGDLLGARQSGLPRFVFTDMFLHRELIGQARDDVRMFLQTDPALTTPRGQALRLLLQLFGFEPPAQPGSLSSSASSGVSSFSTAGTA